MPKIEVNESLFFKLLGERLSRDALEKRLTCAKAELDGWDEKSLPAESRIMKIGLNDTNRPDLWSAAGLARQLKTYATGEVPSYDFLSLEGDLKPASKKIRAEISVKNVRPWLAGFVAKGPGITEPVLMDLIQTQEKLGRIYGRKRSTVSMGIHRSGSISWPLAYKAVTPESAKFVPLQGNRPMNLGEILKEHPTGKEYAYILERESVYPLLLDAKGSILSFPPIINSDDPGAVKTGDTELFVEFTGTHYPSVTLSASMVACDLSDMGYSIEPVRVEYAYDSPDGKTVVTPWYFQRPVSTDLSRVTKFLGIGFSQQEVAECLAKMGSLSQSHGQYITAYPPAFRNDYMHPADVIEDVMIGHGLEKFEPEEPHDFTIGRLTDTELESRKVKDIMVGSGYQEMIYNYLGSGKDLVERMNGDAKNLVRLANPVSGNFEFVRDSQIPNLLASESVSGQAPYPHRIFETGKILKKDATANYGTVTGQYLGFLSAHGESDFDESASLVNSLMYYLGFEYAVRESEDPRFIPGRQAAIVAGNRIVGVFGEIAPEILENWGIAMPTCAGELDIDALVALRAK